MNDNIPEIFNLPVETSIASGDLIPIFDVSAGQIRKITQANLTAGVGVTDHGGLTGLADDDHTQYLLAAGTRALSANWDAGSFEVRAQTFQSDVTTGTAPLIVASTTVCTNLNADTVDGVHASAMYQSGGTDVAVADGGTGRSSHTAYSPICGGTSTTNPQQSVASAGTSGQVLVSGGASALPSYLNRWTHALQGTAAAVLTPADSTSYHFGFVNATTAPSTTAADHRIYIPVTGTIVAAEMTFWATGVAGSDESFTAYVRLNDTTDTSIASVASASDVRHFSNTGLSIAVTAGDYICFKFTTPAWATNPSGVRVGGSVIIRGTA